MMKMLLLLAALVLTLSPAFAQSNDICLTCHEDNSLSTERNGKEISLHVSPDSFAVSKHGSMDCISCHVGFDPDELPHKEKITPVDCSTCHSEVLKSFEQSTHGEVLECSSCHTNVHSPQKKTAILAECQTCHSDETAHYRESVHYTSGSGKGANCINCHSSHNVKSVNSGNCLVCHGQKEFVSKNIKEEKLEFVLKYTESIHGKLIECSDCHGGHEILPSDSKNSSVNRQNLKATCGHCHEKIANEYSKSEHGMALKSGFEYAPACIDCHGEHSIRQITDGQSPVSRQHEIEVCLKCHLDTPEIQKRMTHAAGFISGYEKSIHGRAIAKGNLNAAICSDCHGGHSEMKASNPNSKVYKFNITSTCGACHQDVTNTFAHSVHGKALVSGVEASPTCTDCHGEHEIIEPERKESPVSPTNVSAKVCGPCHGSVKLTEKFGLSSDRFSAYEDSYHGLAVQFGSVAAANCASCHGVHNILPSSDPASKVNKNNLAQTCGKCHPGANENFAKGKVHITMNEQQDTLIYWISTIYIFMIISLVGGMTAHNVLDWFRKAKDKYTERYSEAEPIPFERGSGLYVRMTLSERIQHLALLTSFFTLVITGFMLKFPDAWWVNWIRTTGGETFFGLRGLLHRIAAVVMVTASLYHIYYAIFTQRGREFIRDILFRIQDFKDMIQQLKYNLGFSKKKPKYDRFNYIEKSEYWALVWGTAVMTLTGIALWYENQFMGWFSKLFVDVCTTVHYFEAWLAFLAIVVWHIYYVIFNPNSYPMNFAWLTGKITEEEMEEEHPLELERIKKAQSEEGSEEKSET
jgi:cytochrome b subunit of formate dehydrogenase